MQKIEIHPKLGVNDLKFTMTQNEIKSILGRPSSIDNFITKEPTYYYTELGLAINFNRINNDYIIFSFECEFENQKNRTFLWDVLLTNKSYDEVILLLQSKKIHTYTEADHCDTRYIFYQNISFEFENDRICVLSLQNPDLEY